MRICPLLLVVVGLVLPLAAEEPSPQVRAEKFYQQGLAAIEAGQVQSARTAFENALRLNPKHPNARYQLQELQQRSGELAGKARERKLASVMIPDVRLEDNTVAESLELLGLLVRKISTDQFTPNFVVQDPAKQFEKISVTVRLRNVPASAVLKYVLEQAHATAKYDEHAIVIKPAGGGAAGGH